MEGKLAKNFNTDKLFPELKDKDPVSFDDLYDAMSHWAVSAEQTELDYADFAVAEEGVPKSLKTKK
jgi:hypothetical protein